jgi:hypothetical protein
MIVSLYKDKYIDDRVFWNLLGSGFRKRELEAINKTFRKHFQKNDVTRGKFVKGVRKQSGEAGSLVGMSD